MNEYMVQVILSDTELLAVEGLAGRDPGDWFYASHSLGADGLPGSPNKPWIAYNELPSSANRSVRKTSDSQVRTFQFFVYDDRGYFARINEILRILRRIVKEMAPFTDEDGTRCSDSDWLGFSGNLPADSYDGVCRFGTATFVVSQ